MKKLIVLSFIMAGMMLIAGLSAPAQAQSSAKDDKPTFYHLVPGTYVNSWPRFTVHYPKEWVEAHPHAFEVFRAAPAPVGSAEFGVSAGQLPIPLEKYVDFALPGHKARATDVTVVRDKPSRLRDGTPAREAEFQEVASGTPVDTFNLATEKGGVFVVVTMVSLGGRVGEDLKAYLYSLEFQPGLDEPVKVPPHVQAFLDEYRSATVAHDMEKVMGCHSDRFLNSGLRKAEMGRLLKPWIDRIKTQELTITDFVPEGDRAYLAGFVTFNGQKQVITQTSIIKENGEWKWYGNQREVIP